MRRSGRHLVLITVVLLSISLLEEGRLAISSGADATVRAISPGMNGDGTSPDDDHASAAIAAYPLYTKAVNAYTSGKYADAQELLEQTVEQRGLPAEIMEDAWRKLADCAYFLGPTNGEKSYHQAIQHYHKILALYPDTRAGNDLVHYRLAMSYESVKNDQAAAEQFSAVIVKYPSSQYMQDVFAGIGNIAEKEGRFEHAVNEFRSYLFRYPEGKYAKLAYFMIGDCYYRLRQTVNAEIWFRGALKKWPDLKELPRTILRDIGFHNYQIGRYTEAVSFFSLYVSLYPKDASSPYVMYSLAHALARTGQVDTATNVFGETIEEFPGTREARDSAVSMVDLEVDTSATKAKLRAVFGMDSGYREPIFAYDSFLAKYPRGEMAEHLLYRKGYALFKRNHPVNALQAFDRLLALNPAGRYSESGKRYLKMATALAVDEVKEDDLAVADIYFQSYGRHPLSYEDHATCYRMARSLVAVGLYTESITLLKELVRRESDPTRRDALGMFAAEISRLDGRDRDAEELLLGLLADRGRKSQVMVPKIKRDLARIYFLRGDWEKSVRNYGDIGNSDRSEMSASDFLRYAEALNVSKQYGQAMTNYRRAAKIVQESPDRYPSRLLSETYMGMGECLYRENNFSEGLRMYQQALPGLQERRDLWWVNSRIGQGYTRLNRLDLGERSFAEAKTGSAPDDAFTLKMIEAWKENSLWIEQNRKYIGLP